MSNEDVPYEVVDTETGQVISSGVLPAGHPIFEALKPDAPHHTREEWTLMRQIEEQQP